MFIFLCMTLFKNYNVLHNCSNILPLWLKKLLRFNKTTWAYFYVFCFYCKYMNLCSNRVWCGNSTDCSGLSPILKEICIWKVSSDCLPSSLLILLSPLISFLFFLLLFSLIYFYPHSLSLSMAKCGPLEKGIANHFSILALRTPWTVWKGKKIGHWKMNSPGR